MNNTAWQYARKKAGRRAEQEQQRADHEREQAGARVVQVARRVAQGSQSERERDHDQEHALQEVEVGHGLAGAICCDASVRCGYACSCRDTPPRTPARDAEQGQHP